MSSECIICLDLLLPNQPTYTCTNCNIIVHKVCKEKWFNSRAIIGSNKYICPHCKYTSIVNNINDNQQLQLTDIRTIEPINIQHDIQYTNEELATYRQINTIKNGLKCTFIFTCICMSFGTVIVGIYSISEQFLIQRNYTITV